MFRFVGLCFGILVRLFREWRSLLLENLALRQQLVALKRRHPRPSLGPFDKLLWVIARRVWSAWKQSLIIVTPETVVRWHRGGFRLYWKLISKVRRPVGRRQTSKEVQELIFRMVVENQTWGAPRIHGELRMLGLCELANVELESDLRDIASQAGARIGLETMSTDEELRSAVIHKAGEHNIQLQPEQVTVPTRAWEKSR